MLKKNLSLLFKNTSKLSDEDKITQFSSVLYAVALWQMGVGIISKEYLSFFGDAALLIIVGLLNQYLKNKILSVVIFVLIFLAAAVNVLDIFFRVADDAPKVPGDLAGYAWAMFLTAFLGYKSMRATFKYRGKI